LGEALHGHHHLETMESTMSDRIRYARGQGSLGSFIVARSDRGLVAFEFERPGVDAVAALSERIADAAIEEDAEGLAPTVAALARLVDEPDHDPGLPLDMIGTDYQKRVWTLLRAIPPGQTASYGEIAARMGTPRDARDATAAIAANAIAILVPCHRVVKKDGSLSGYRWGSQRKRALLAREQARRPLPLEAPRADS
jgi:AraC family transcriptional regulator, regulatory protein of adaptative response / methylated-DNA-[protein]-cysteine methyltransferase